MHLDWIWKTILILLLLLFSAFEERKGSSRRAERQRQWSFFGVRQAHTADSWSLWTSFYYVWVHALQRSVSGTALAHTVACSTREPGRNQHWSSYQQQWEEAVAEKRAGKLWTLGARVIYGSEEGKFVSCSSSVLFLWEYLHSGEAFVTGLQEPIQFWVQEKLAEIPGHYTWKVGFIGSDVLKQSLNIKPVGERERGKR